MTSSNESRTRSKDIILTPLGRRVKELAKVTGVVALAATTAVVALGSKDTSRTSAEMAPVSAIEIPDTKKLEAMDTMVAKELAKGPEAEDLVVNDGLTFTIGPSSTVVDAMTRVDKRANPSGDNIFQTKATTASAENFNPDREYVYPEDEAIMWQDAELTAANGRAVLLAIPVNRPEL